MAGGRWRLRLECQSADAPKGDQARPRGTLAWGRGEASVTGHFVHSGNVVPLPMQRTLRTDTAVRQMWMAAAWTSPW